MDKQKNIPTLRFPEYTGDWERKKLNEIGDFKNGINKSKEDFGFGVPFINLMDVFGKATISNLKLDLVNANKKELKLYELKKGDVLFIRSSVKKSGVGETSLVMEDLIDTVFSGFLIRFRDEKIQLKLNFKRYCFSTKTFRESLISLSTTSANTNINQESLNELGIYFPSHSEQNKIAAFLTAFDDRLNQLKQKKTLLEQYKKGVMLELFGQEIRFKDNNGNEFPDWEEKNGNFIFENISDKNHNSDLPILAITQEFGAIPRDLIDFNISVTDKSVESYKVVQVGDFIISLRSFQGGIEFSNYKGICSPAYIILRSIIAIDKKFYKFYFKTESYIKLLNLKLEGIRDGKMISYKYFSDIKLPFPSLAEQSKIANFISAIDEKINQSTDQISKTEQYKKGLLQQMFV